MSTKSNLIRILAVSLFASFAAAAQAEVSQEEQLRQAQAAYEAAAQTGTEVAEGWQEMQDAAVVVRDTAVEVLELLGNFN